ncbi:thioredoxin [Streptobacillus ratti]|uniref:thioredoxin n=1 Tax=Streptobacillus ratti TaxID=1720557 RepID=UPI0009332A7C|nr:thioredoxin [Streptobacillus ratti]
MSKVLHLGAVEQLKEICEKEKVVLVDFFATWCGPCKRLGPVLDELSEEADFSIVKIDVDQFPELAGEYGVRSIPTLFVVKDGEKVATDLGFKTKEELISLVKNNI